MARDRRIEISGHREIGDTADRVYAALHDDAILLHCVPGCQRIDTAVSGGKILHVAGRLGPFEAAFSGRVRYVPQDPPRRLRVEATQWHAPSTDASGSPAPDAGHTGVTDDDRDGGRPGAIAVTGDIDLSPSLNGTRLAYRLLISPGSAPFDLASWVVDGAARVLAGMFFDRLRDSVPGWQPPAPDPPAPDPPAGDTSWGGDGGALAPKVLTQPEAAARVGLPPLVWVPTVSLLAVAAVGFGV